MPDRLTPEQRRRCMKSIRSRDTKPEMMVRRYLSKRMNWTIFGKNDKRNNMTIFKFKDIGEALGTRQLGARVREMLLPLIEANDKVVLDFEGVSVVSNSFADECLAKLLLVMPFEELKRRTTFVSVNDFARRNIAIAFRRRMQQAS